MVPWHKQHLFVVNTYLHSLFSLYNVWSPSAACLSPLQKRARTIGAGTELFVVPKKLSGRREGPASGQHGSYHGVGVGIGVGVNKTHSGGAPRGALLNYVDRGTRGDDGVGGGGRAGIRFNTASYNNNNNNGGGGGGSGYSYNDRGPSGHQHNLQPPVSQRGAYVGNGGHGGNGGHDGNGGNGGGYGPAAFNFSNRMGAHNPGGHGGAPPLRPQGPGREAPRSSSSLLPHGMSTAAVGMGMGMGMRMAGGENRLGLGLVIGDPHAYSRQVQQELSTPRPPQQQQRLHPQQLQQHLPQQQQQQQQQQQHHHPQQLQQHLPQQQQHPPHQQQQQHPPQPQHPPQQRYPQQHVPVRKASAPAGLAALPPPVLAPATATPASRDAILAMVASRESARRAADWTTADHIRCELQKAGVEMHDKDRRWVAKDGRNGSTLESPPGQNDVAGSRDRPSPVLASQVAAAAPRHFNHPCTLSDKELANMLREREVARKEKNFAVSDSLRKQLRAAGVQIDDKKRSWAAADGRCGTIGIREGAVVGDGTLGSAALKDLLRKREAARANKEWTVADELRIAARANGVDLQDKLGIWKSLDGRAGALSTSKPLSEAGTNRLIELRRAQLLIGRFDNAASIRAEMESAGAAIDDADEHAWRSNHGTSGVAGVAGVQGSRGGAAAAAAVPAAVFEDPYAHCGAYYAAYGATAVTSSAGAGAGAGARGGGVPMIEGPYAEQWVEYFAALAGQPPAQVQPVQHAQQAHQRLSHGLAMPAAMNAPQLPPYAPHQRSPQQLQQHLVTLPPQHMQNALPSQLPQRREQQQQQQQHQLQPPQPQPQPQPQLQYQQPLQQQQQQRQQPPQPRQQPQQHLFTPKHFQMLDVAQQQQQRQHLPPPPQHLQPPPHLPPPPHQVLQQGNRLATQPLLTPAHFQ